MSQIIRLFAAGSLRTALGDAADAFQAATGVKIDARYGASGLLKDEIMAGAPADVFASANMEHPLALAEAGLFEPPKIFARNRLCALVRPGLSVTPTTLLRAMLDPGVRVATSTPIADPSGDYAFDVFRKADAIVPGARNTLEAKALKLTGSPDSASAPAGRTVYGWHIAEGRADIFLTYWTNAITATKQNPGQQIVALPEELSVAANYGLTIRKGSPGAVSEFADSILSVDGQRIIVNHGFSSPTPGDMK